MTDERLIAAAHAYADAQYPESPLAPENEYKAEIAEAAYIAGLEAAPAPTDDERAEWTASLESLIADVYTILKPIAENGSQGPNSPILKAYGLLNAQDLRRSEVPEPSADDGHDGWCGCGKCGPEPQGEPSDAEVDAAADAIRWASERGGWVDMARAALRAAGGAR